MTRNGCIRHAFFFILLLVSALIVLSTVGLAYLEMRNKLMMKVLEEESWAKYHEENADNSVTRNSTAANFNQTLLQCARDSMTVVSGFMNIGDFNKAGFLKFTVEDYRSWAQPLRLIENPLIFFTDDAPIAKLVSELRSSHGLADCTCVQLVKRSDLWGFDLLPRISELLQQPFYPKYHPNTVVPEYGAAMHSKFAMLEMAMDTNPFQTEYFAWMDSGLFRTDMNWKNPILLLLPPGFNKKFIAANQVKLTVDVHSTFLFIFLQERAWYVGGGFLIAQKDVMRRWCTQYREFTEYFLDMGLTNSDQQVIYGMFTDAAAQRFRKLKSPVRIQRYAPSIYQESWYHLRRLSLDEGVRQKQRDALLSNFTNLLSPKAFFKHYHALKETETSYAEINDSRNYQCHNDVTIVVAFFSVGSTAARIDDEKWEFRDSDHYSLWLKALAKASNPIVAYFDTIEMLTEFRKSRDLVNVSACTSFRLIDRQALWSWRLLPWLIHVLREDSSFHNGGLIPEYVASLHSKYAVMEKATEANPFNSTHFAWLDASLLRFDKKSLPFTVNKASNHSHVIEFLLKNQYNSSSNFSSVSICDYEWSTRYLIGETHLMHLLSKVYRIAAEASLRWRTVMKDEEILRAVYCWSNMSRVVSEQFDSSLPRLEPLANRRPFGVAIEFRSLSDDRNYDHTCILCSSDVIFILVVFISLMLLTCLIGLAISLFREEQQLTGIRYGSDMQRTFFPEWNKD